MAVHLTMNGAIMQLLPYVCNCITAQVLRDGQWYTVQPIPGALTINVGDMAQVGDTAGMISLMAAAECSRHKCRFPSQPSLHFD